MARELEKVAVPAAVAAILILVAIVATGTPAKPLRLDYPDWNLKWDYVLPRILDLENQGVSLTLFSTKVLFEMTAGAVAVWLILIAIAVRRRDSIGSGVLIGPFIAFLVLLATGATAAAFQMIGTFYPFLLCGAAMLIDWPRRRADESPSPNSLIAEAPRPGASALGYDGVEKSSVKRGVALAGISLLAISAISLRVPRYIGSLQRYAGSKTPPVLQFSERDTDRLAERIANQIVEVDVDKPQQALFLLVELGRRRGTHFQWTPRSWKRTVGYTDWPVPNYTFHPLLRIALSGDDQGLRVIKETRQYDLLDCTKPAAP